MNDDERFDFYAGCALIGLLSHHGTVSKSIAVMALDMAEHMKDMKEVLNKGIKNDD